MFLQMKKLNLSFIPSVKHIVSGWSVIELSFLSVTVNYTHASNFTISNLTEVLGVPCNPLMLFTSITSLFLIGCH